MITRRGLLAGILSAGVSPWIVKAGVLMPVKRVIVPEWGDSIAGLTQQYQVQTNLQLHEMIARGFIKYDEQFVNPRYRKPWPSIRRVSLNEDWMPLHLT